jgi:hypothetical protein
MSVAALGGFALIAAYSTQGDSSLPPTATLAVLPIPPLAPGQEFTIIWNTFNVAKVRIHDPLFVFDTGVINNPSTSGGSLLVPGGFASTLVLTLYCFDSSGNPLVITPVPTYTVVIT